ncbi:unnamed protein product, partial [Ectocarpus sp. 13 AM-2016]
AETPKWNSSQGLVSISTERTHTREPQMPSISSDPTDVYSVEGGSTRACTKYRVAGRGFGDKNKQVDEAHNLATRQSTWNGISAHGREKTLLVLEAASAWAVRTRRAFLQR